MMLQVAGDAPVGQRFQAFNLNSIGFRKGKRKEARRLIKYSVSCRKLSVRYVANVRGIG
jgi:hypothetical protein